MSSEVLTTLDKILLQKTKHWRDSSTHTHTHTHRGNKGHVRKINEEKAILIAVKKSE